MAIPDKTEASLSHQYGGHHASRWVDLFPKSWIPFIQLARLDPPAALFLIYFPHLFGILQAAKTNRSPAPEVLRVCVLLMGGTFFFSNAAHTWNDLVDSPIDKQVARTKKRPIPRGAISSFKAFLFAVSQAFGAASYLLFFSPTTALATLPTIIGTIYYPWAKKHTYFPQVILGLCLAWGIVVGNAAMGIPNPWKETGILLLVLASTLWTVIYDTIYAYQDVVDDKRIGVKSLAVLFGENTKGLLWAMFVLMGSVLVVLGRNEEMGIGYYVVTLGGCTGSLGLMVYKVELDDEASCWKWFSTGFWATGSSIAVGLLVEYLAL